MGIVPNGLLALCGALCAECYKQFLIALAKVVILLRPSRSMDLCERIMGVEHELPGALLGSARFFLGAMVSTPLFPHNREGYDMAGQAVLTPSVPPRPHWCETARFLEVHAPPAIHHAIVMDRERLWCVGDEDFRGQQQPDHAGRMLQRGATHLATPWPEGDFRRIGQFVDPALDVPAGGRPKMQLLCRHRDAPLLFGRTIRETLYLVCYAEATEPPSTACQAGHRARAWLCLLTLIELR